MLRPTDTHDLIEELLSTRKKSVNENDLLNEVEAIFKKNSEEREAISKKIKSSTVTNVNVLQFDLLETDKIFHIEQIKKVCIANRLRFLDSTLFKNEIPEEAITKINHLEKKHLTTLDGFKIMAPSKAFELVNYDDPLLFVPMDNDYYYLIHKWGNDLAWYRKLAVLPVKNMLTFIIACGIVSALLTAICPVGNLGKNMALAPLILFLFMFKSVIAASGYYFFVSGRNFNSEIWDRKFKEN